MLTLSLLRHAKAVPYGYGDDFSRQLADKGKDDTMRLGVYLAERGGMPDLALVSSAVRTTQTFQILETSARQTIPARFDPVLYNATPSQLRDMLKLIEPSIKHLMVVGHNPGIMELAIVLARDGDLIDFQRLRTSFPPATLAELVFDTDDWLDARAAGGRLDVLLTPADLVAPG